MGFLSIPVDPRHSEMAAILNFNIKKAGTGYIPVGVLRNCTIFGAISLDSTAEYKISLSVGVETVNLKSILLARLLFSLGLQGHFDFPGVALQIMFVESVVFQHLPEQPLIQATRE